MLTKEAMFGMYIGQKYTTNKSLKNLNTGNHLWAGTGNVTSEFIADLSIQISWSYCKLILRPFESMTDEEMEKFRFLCGVDKYGDMDNDAVCKIMENSYYTIEEIEYLISIGIDVFNLKERGWAIYEKGVKRD